MIITLQEGPRARRFHHIMRFCLLYGVTNENVLQGMVELEAERQARPPDWATSGANTLLRQPSIMEVVGNMVDAIEDGREEEP